MASCSLGFSLELTFAEAEAQEPVCAGDDVAIRAVRDDLQHATAGIAGRGQSRRHTIERHCPLSDGIVAIDPSSGIRQVDQCKPVATPQEPGGEILLDEVSVGDVIDDAHGIVAVAIERIRQRADGRQERKRHVLHP
jgi:hypothetical protein